MNLSCCVAGPTKCLYLGIHLSCLIRLRMDDDVEAQLWKEWVRIHTVRNGDGYHVLRRFFVGNWVQVSLFELVGVRAYV